MKKTLITLSLLLLVGAGCMGSSSPSTPSSTTPPPAAGGNLNNSAQGNAQDSGADTAATQVVGTWTFVSLKQPGVELAKDASGLGLTLSFGADGKLSAKVCNSMSGSYRIVEGNHLISTDVVATKMFCEGVSGEMESAFLADLAVGMGVARSGDTLLLNGATGDVFTFSRK